MACLDRETATAYLRGDLEHQEAERWAAHLGSCDVCRACVQEVSALIDDVRRDLLLLDSVVEPDWPRFAQVIEHDSARQWPAPARMRPELQAGRGARHAISWHASGLRQKTIGLTMASLVALGVMLWLRGTSVSAAELLQRAAVAERAVEDRSGQVLYRVLTVEERRGGAQPLISRRRIEAWRKAGTAVAARRVFDQAGRLIDAEWIDAAGARTVYTPDQLQGHPSEPSAPTGSLFLRDARWQVDLSAQLFSSLVEAVDRARVTERADTFTIHYEAAAANAIITAATLTLSKPGLHAIEQTVRIGHGDKARELRIVEDRYTPMRADAVSSTVFEPEMPRRTSRPATPAMKRLSDVQLLSLEVRALQALDGIGALLGEQVNVSRTPTGTVRVDAMVDSPARDQEIERALAALGKERGVEVDVETFAAAAARHQPPAPQAPVVRQVDVPVKDIPVGATLRRYFEQANGQAVDPTIDETIRRFAHRTVERSQRLVQHAWAMKRLTSRYTAQERSRLDERSATVWRGLISKHAAMVADEGQALGDTLQPIFLPGETPSVPAPSLDEIPNSRLANTVDRILTLANRQAEAVRTAFSASNAPRAGTFEHTNAFLAELAELTQLARAIAIT